MSESTVEELTKKVEILKQEAIIASAKEREALYSFKMRRWNVIGEVFKQFFYFAAYSVLVISFFGACCYGCSQPTTEETLALQGLRRAGDGWGRTVIEKIPNYTAATETNNKQ